MPNKLAPINTKAWLIAGIVSVAMGVAAKKAVKRGRRRGMVPEKGRD